jgi:hypothetical protein
VLNRHVALASRSRSNQQKLTTTSVRANTNNTQLTPQQTATNSISARYAK